MRTTFDTQLSLFEWATILGINPFEMAQFGIGFPQTNTANAQCEHVFFQYSYQQDFLSRDEIGETIQKAEAAIAEQLLFWPAPRAITNEVAQYPRPAERYLYGAGTDKRWQKKGIELKWNEIQAAGVFVRTAINLVAAIVYSDRDGDGVKETFTVTVATSVTDPGQIALYYTSADRLGDPIDETWRIRPVTVTISGGNAVIVGSSSLCVPPAKEVSFSADVLDVSDTANFVTQFEVYQLSVDSSTTQSDPAQGVALWDGFPNDCLIPPCEAEVWPICLSFMNADQGFMGVDYWLAGQNCPTQWREPDRVTVNYVAGKPRQSNGKMDRTMADIVAHLACGWLPVDKCGCERSSRIIHWWRSFPQDGMDTRNITQAEIDTCPFATPTMGVLYAWKQIKVLNDVGIVNI